MALDQPLIAKAETVYLSHAVVVIEAEHYGADHVIDPRAEPATGDDTASYFLWFEKDALPWSRQFQGRWLQVPFEAAADVTKTVVIEDSFIVAGKPNPPHGGRKPALPESLDGEIKFLVIHGIPPGRLMISAPSYPLNIVVPVPRNSDTARLTRSAMAVSARAR